MRRSRLSLHLVHAPVQVEPPLTDDLPELDRSATRLVPDVPEEGPELLAALLGRCAGALTSHPRGACTVESVLQLRLVRDQGLVGIVNVRTDAGDLPLESAARSAAMLRRCHHRVQVRAQ